jgi:hypothetical protein
MSKTVDVFSNADKRYIRDCARRVAGATEKAIAVHRAYLRTHGVRRGDPYFDFMSEVDNPCPDLLLRSRYREAVLAISSGDRKSES